VRIVILRLKYISNFTDFAPFLYEPDVELRYSLWEEDIKGADLIIIPGSKNTVSDLLFLRESGVEDSVRAAAERGTPVAGICGGYQMLGMKILDPHGVESPLKEVRGMGLLDTVTTLDRTKTTCRVSAVADCSRLFDTAQAGTKKDRLKGYEIHMGNTTGDTGLFKIFRGTSRRGIADGSVKGSVWGTYIHGIFDNDGFRTSLINALRARKGLQPRGCKFSYRAKREEAINRWADTLRNSVDICFMLRQAGLKCCLGKSGRL